MAARYRAGDLVADRFHIEAEAGSGGMGVVYRARDRQSGERIALKVLAQTDPIDASRFERERAILAELDHPGIVRYVDHSRGTEHPAWLAMEWLEGETLAARLRRGPLGVAAAVRTVRDAASALGRAHALGIVHRDLKPANLFVLAEDPERVLVLDFGIARRTASDASTLTTTGTVLGTPYYMAPEQARGSREIDPRIDVYALGCVLYESLTGRRPFEHESVVAVLAAVLLEDPPSPREHSHAVPDALDALVLTMLSKRAALRPADGEQVSRLLSEMLDDEASLRASTSPTPRALTGREQRVVCVVLVDGGGLVPENGRTLATSQGEDLAGRVRAVVEPLSGEVVTLADGSLVVTPDTSGTATDQAARAARCALAIREAAPLVAIAIAAGRALVTGRVPVGEVVQRGADMLRGSGLAASPQRAAIRLDEAVASLLDDRFVIRIEGGLPHLDGIAGEPDTPRDSRAGSPPLLGRDRELAQLLAIFDEACAEPIARLAVITGVSGCGKSRLLDAFLARVTSRGARIVSVRADPLGESAPFSLAAELVRSAAGIARGEPLAERRQKLTRLAERSAGMRLAVMLGELCRAPFDVDDDPVLAGVRRDPVLRGDLERRAFEDWLELECGRGPVVLCVDDAHYADRASLGLLDGTVRLLGARPIVLLIAGRSGPDEAYAEVFSERDPARIALGRLLPRAARALVERELALGTRVVDPDVAQQIVERGDGNPLYLEELARAVREGNTELPTSVLAMVEARLAILAAETRRVARAASVFGVRAPDPGIRVLVGKRPIDDALFDLVEREILSEERSTRGDVRWLAWRQPLMCDAAYAMLTEDDRALGHRLAGEWLAENAEVEPSVLARHFELGGSPDVAARAWAGAAELALAANDLSGALGHAARGLALATDAGARATLLATLAEAHRWRAEYGPAFARAEEALACAIEGAPAYLAAASTFVSAALRLHRSAEISKLSARLEALDTTVSERPSQISLLCRLASHDLSVRDEAAFERRMTRADALAASLSRPDPIASAWIRTLRASHAYEVGELDEFVEGTTLAVRDYVAGGDARDACNQRVRLAHGWLALGEPARAESELALALDDARRMGLRLVEGYALQNLGHARARAMRTPDAIRTLGRAIEIAASVGDAMLEAGARVYLAECALDADQIDDAMREAARAVALATGPLFAIAESVLARALARGGRHEEALARARAARRAVPASDSEADAHVTLALAECLAACGQNDDARATAASGLARVRARAERIGSLAWREAYLTRVPQHARLAALGQ